MKNRTPLIYLCIHKRLKERFRFHSFSVKELFWMLGKIYHIEKRFNYLVLKELEDYKLLKRINLREAQLLNCKINLENTSRLYRIAGLY